MYNQAAKKYRRVHVESATKERVLDELYGRLLRDLAVAGAAIRRGDIAAKSDATDHALRIITELTAALDTSAAPELCQNLENLYDFAAARIMAASGEMRASPLAEARQIIETLREAFREAVQAAK